MAENTPPSFPEIIAIGTHIYGTHDDSKNA